MTHKLALLAATASLTFAGAAIAQTTTTPANPTGPMPPAQTTSPAQAATPPFSPPPANPADPAAPAQPGMSPAHPANPALPPSANPADSAATPSSANVAAAFKVGMAVKDAQGVSVGQITGTSTGADGSTNVIVTNGGVKFALPSASLSATADGGVQTTATKAQIDATVAGAKPQ